MRHWDLDDEYEHQGAHVFLPGGNLRLLQALAAGLPVMYKATARLVRYSNSGVEVHSDAGVFRADAALVTVPLGALKAGGPLAFSPPLPPTKAAAVSALGFGCLNKVVLLFPSCFWGTYDMFGHVITDDSPRGRYYLFYTYDGLAGGAVLAALVAGDAALAHESSEDDVAVAAVMSLLRGIFSPQGVEVPEPLQALCTRWGADPLCRGSYSSVAVGSRGAADYEALAQPLGRLFFAGEATTRRYPATMHGAFATGLREAANIMTTLAEARGEQPRPRHTTANGGKVGAAAAESGRRLMRLASMLSQVFDDPDTPPDEEFGNVRAVYGPSGTPLHDSALTAIGLPAVRSATGATVLGSAGRAGAAAASGGVVAAAAASASGGGLAVYAVLTRQQLALLREVPGDTTRVGVLGSELGVKLVGRGMDTQAEAMLEAIVAARKCSNTHAHAPS